jgi:glycosyltransferase involved in cell wall biosynthesis
VTADRTILLVSPYRVEYGPREVLEHVAGTLSEAGFRTVCVVPRGGEITDALRRSSAAIHVVDRLGTFPRTLNAARLAGFLRAHFSVSREIAQVARDEGALAIYSISEAIFAGSLAAKQLRIPSIVHVIGMSIQSPRIGAHVYIRFLERFTDRFIGCSSAVAEMLFEFGAQDSQITVVHNGISVAAVDETEGLPSPVDFAGPRVGMIAAYDPRKGHELFVEAAARIVESHSDARFYLIGGSLRGQSNTSAFEERIWGLIERLGLTDRFEHVGYVAPPDVYAWIRAMDVIVVPSRTEAFAHALLEAMACGKAIVATGIEGNLDALVQGHSGIYVPSSPPEMAAAVSRLLDDPELARRLGAAARVRVLRYFDLSVTQPVIPATVEQVLAEAEAEARNPPAGRAA